MNARIAPPATISDEALNHPHSVAAFRGMKLAVGGYAGFSLLTLVAVYLLRHNPALVNDTAWIRGGIVAGTSVLMLSFVTGAARGRRRAYLRLRIASALMVVSIAALVVLPGLLPAWMRIEQSVCGLLLAAVVVIANGKHLRSMFATA
ncbi:hypothetical protein GCM10023194_68320 [Planotetraspora phitsanulokensis]|uniref:Uncharacterized protein n=1 Tax=Planotetraspora phitsanulokensis TaxID=575192 RepID=A0A8J3XFY5_9ACTN|nr:hypothetical protein [Planotetraspora phitsanulokensis]GII39605.1 hypothetical protein Pph01_46080 [Planotetraspora phitsanulokensis]